MLSDYLTRPGSQDRSRIDITEPQEVSWWVDALSVTEEELRVAVAKVGVDAKDVQTLLGKA